MVLAKSRVPSILAGVVILLGFVLFIIAGRAAAHNVPAGPLLNLDTGWVTWTWMAQGQTVKADVYINPAITDSVFAIEFFVNPETGTAPVSTQRMGNSGAFPTGQTLSFIFGIPPVAPTSMAIHLHGSGAPETAILLAASNTLGVPPPTPTPVPPPPAPVATPVPTTVVPIGQAVAVPAGGAVSVIQPNAAGAVSAPDGKVVVSVPVTAYATTFQLAYNPAPANVPAAPADLNILRAFDLTAYDSNGVALSITLLNSLTITAKYTAADGQAAPGSNPLNLKILSYDASTKAWSSLNTTVDLAAQTLEAKVGHLSFFAVGAVQPPLQAIPTPTPTPSGPAPTPTPPKPTPTPTPKLPPAGDATPGAGLLAGLMLLGVLMVVTGGAYLTLGKKTRRQDA